MNLILVIAHCCVRPSFSRCVSVWQEETSLEELTGFTFFNNSTQPIFRTSYWDGMRKRNKTSVYFLAEFVEGAQISIQAGELIDYVWLSAAPAKQRMNYPEMSQLIDAAMAAMA